MTVRWGWFMAGAVVGATSAGMVGLVLWAAEMADRIAGELGAG